VRTISALFVDDEVMLREQYAENLAIAMADACDLDVRFEFTDRIEEAKTQLLRGQTRYELVFVDLLWSAIGGGGGVSDRGLEVVAQAAKTPGVTIVAFSVGDTKGFPELPEDAKSAGAHVFRIRGALQAAARYGAWDRLASEICEAMRANSAVGGVPEVEQDPPHSGTPVAARRTIFVVVGRHKRLVRSLFELLRSVQLVPLEWEVVMSSAIRSGRGGGNPNVFDIVEHGFHIAHGTIVLFSPDDVAYLLPEHRNDRDEDFESRLTPQPRPNVLLEAGYALRHDRAHTLIVSVGILRPVSDLGGMHLLRLDETAGSRKAFIDRLLAMGFDLDASGKDWLTAGDFSA
jgi:predicted nucleotide-binding protein